MSDDWKDSLRKLKARFFGVHSQNQASQSSQVNSAGSSNEGQEAIQEDRSSSLTPIEINLGIDFGTSYTKVCFRDTGAEHSGVVRFPKNSSNLAIISSSVWVSRDGQLLMDYDRTETDDCIEIKYLKMRLAGDHIESDEPLIEATVRYSDEGIRALCAWHIARIISDARNYVRKTEAARLMKRRQVWSANVGVPVAYCDSPVINDFRKVIGVAWNWATTNKTPRTYEEALHAYRNSEQTAQPLEEDIHAVPEISAAVHSFVMSRNSVPGVYIYFDIGGGTVDGVAFEFRNWDGHPYIDFYSGRVEPLGIEVRKLAFEQPRSEDESNIQLDFQNRLTHLVAWVAIEAKSKDPKIWQVDARATPARQGLRHLLRTKEMLPQTVFLGGYGAHDDWYRSAIESVYEVRKLANSGIPPWIIKLTPAPSDLS
ncbi:MAG TPA: hypothetical protein P5307_23920, partial [Pirellulaceae bacterium]|nr:hypothetical protein [Pirellulaceae bacterium]